ncbi:hypothetical protein V2J09_020647 [Rumex salicifolius]
MTDWHKKQQEFNLKNSFKRQRKRKKMEEETTKDKAFFLIWSSSISILLSGLSAAMPSMYPHAKCILLALKDKGIDVAIASRSSTADIAKVFLDKLEVQSIFVAQVSKMGVTSILVDNGVNLEALRQGLTKFKHSTESS